jgi:hypothetical protein
MKCLALLALGTSTLWADASGFGSVFRVLAARCDPLRGGTSGTAFAVRAGERQIAELYFITALHVVNGCEDLTVILEGTREHPYPVSSVRVRLSYVDFQRDLAALTLADAKATSGYFQDIDAFRLASEPNHGVPYEDVAIMYYSNTSYRRDQRSTSVTIWPPLALEEITQNVPSFPWQDLKRANLGFLRTQVIRLSGVAWEGFSGAPLVRNGGAAPTAIGVVDGGVHERLQWAIPAWQIEWKPEAASRSERSALLKLGSRIRLFSEAPVRDQERNGVTIRFIGLPSTLFDRKDSQTFHFVQESELSNAQARALGWPIRHSRDLMEPFLTKTIGEASAICGKLNADLLTLKEFTTLLTHILDVDDQACFANLGGTAADRGCHTVPPTGINGPEIDVTASVAYGAVDRYTNHLGLRNLIGNAWEWTGDGMLAGGAVDTRFSASDAEGRLKQLIRKNGEGTVRCVQRQ